MPKTGLQSMTNAEHSQQRFWLKNLAKKGVKQDRKATKTDTFFATIGFVTHILCGVAGVHTNFSLKMCSGRALFSTITQPAARNGGMEQSFQSLSV